MSRARRYLLDLLGPAGDEDDLIGQVEDDRAHEEAEKLRSYADSLDDEYIPGRQAEQWTLRAAASRMDPYEMRDGQLVRKSDGKPVTI